MAQHDGRLFVLGGRVGGVFLDDVWASNDEGATWTQVATTRFPPRYDACAASFGGALFAVGGTTAVAEAGRAELWRSTDGAVWSQVALRRRRRRRRDLRRRRWQRRALRLSQRSLTGAFRPRGRRERAAKAWAALAPAAVLRAGR